MPTMLSGDQWIAMIIAAITLLGVAFGRLPLTRLNRASIALIGATALVFSGVLDLEHAWRSIDGEIIVMLLALMILNTYLTEGGFFRVLMRTAVVRARSGLALLVLLSLTSGILSAFFLNDTIVLMLTTLVVQLCYTLKLPPVPFLIALAASANVGSVATITGNPQNLVVGLESGIGYLEFAAALSPVAVAGLAVVIGIVAIGHWRQLNRRLEPAVLPPLNVDRRLLWQAALVSSGLVLALLLGAPMATAALVAAATLLLIGQLASDRVLAQVDWNLLLLFAGLFVVVGALEETGVSAALFASLASLLESGVAGLAALTVLLSNLLSNVPAVVLLSPLIHNLEEPHTAWLTVAMASTLAGNLTLVGSVANLIVAELARRQGVTVGFWRYLALGAPITLISVTLGVLWLQWLTAAG